MALPVLGDSTMSRVVHGVDGEVQSGVDVCVAS